jgi:hypothetical protein
MTLNPLVKSIVSTLLSHELNFSLVLDDHLIIHNTITIEMNYAHNNNTRSSIITFAEREHIQYPNIMWASFTRYGSLPDKKWLINLELGIHIQHQHTSSLISEDTIAIFRMEFIENPIEQPDNTLYFMEMDISSKNDWDQILHTDIIHWINAGITMEQTHEQSMSETETEYNDEDDEDDDQEI